jgi:hypothetical protein
LIDLPLQARESRGHTAVKLSVGELGVLALPDEVLLNLVKLLLDAIELLVDLFEPLIDLVEAFVDLLEAFVDLPKRAVMSADNASTLFSIRSNRSDNPFSGIA